MLYLLNTPILTSYGEYRFEGPLTLQQAREIASQGYSSAIGHPGAAQLLSFLLEHSVAVQRVRVELQPADQALVLRVLERLPEGAVLAASELAAIPTELGLITRTA